VKLVTWLRRLPTRIAEAWLAWRQRRYIEALREHFASHDRWPDEQALDAAISKLANADGERAVTLTAEEGAALLRRLGDLDLNHARYRWIRTHQYQGIIDPHDPCDPNSPCATNFDRRIDGLRRECP
jgi:hypothetical protein